MPIIRLDSLDAPELGPYRQLKATNLTRWSGQFICEGDKLVCRLLASRYPAVSVLAADRLVDRYAPLVPECVPLYLLPEDDLSRLVGFRFHHGVLACGQRGAQASLAELLGRKSDRLRLAVCPDVQDPENLGSILRSSAALGVDGVLLGPAAADPFSRRVLRCSMGASLELPLMAPRRLEPDLRMLVDDGVELIATVLDSTAEPLDLASRPARWAVMFGSEGQGLAPRWIELATRRWTIPMTPRVDSLNVGVAAAIFLYHLTGPHDGPNSLGVGPVPRGPNRSTPGN